MEPVQLVYPLVLFIGGVVGRVSAKPTTASAGQLPVYDAPPRWVAESPAGGGVLAIATDPDGLIATVSAPPGTAAGTHVLHCEVVSFGQTVVASREVQVRPGGQVVAVQIVDAPAPPSPPLA